jgi:tetratricopeptide (TPR) repeat protein
MATSTLRINIDSLQNFKDKLVHFLSKIDLYFIFFVVLIFPFVLSEVYSQPSIFPKYILFLFTAFILVIVFGVKVLLSKKVTTNKSIHRLLFAFLVAYIFSSVTSPAPMISFIGIHGRWTHGAIAVVGMIFGAIAVSTIIESEKELENFAFVQIFPAAIAASIGIIFSFILSERNPSTFSHPISYSMYISTLSPIPLIFLLKKNYKSTSTVFKILSGLALLLILGGILTSQTRAPMLSLLIVSFAVLFTEVSKLGDIKSKRRIILFGIFMVAATLFFARYRWFDIFNSPREQNSVLIRLSEWRTALQVFLRVPIKGTGPEHLQSLYGRLKDSWLAGSTDWQFRTAYIRSVPLNILATTGLMGFIPFVVFSVSLIKSIIKNIKSSNLLKKYFSAALLIWFLNHLFYYFTPGSLLLGMILIGVQLSFINDTSKSESEKFKKLKMPDKDLKLFSKLRYFILVVWLVFAAAIIVQITKIEAAERKYTQALVNNDGAQRMDRLEKVIILNPYEPVYRRKKAWLLVEYLSTREDFTDFKYSREIEEEYNRAISMNPSDSMTYLEAAQSMLNLDLILPYDDYDMEAVRYGEKALEFEPYHPEFLDSLGQYYMEAGMYKSAEKVYSKAINLKADYGPAYLHKARVLIHLERYSEAKELLENAQKVVDDDNFEAQADELLIEIKLNN